MAGINANHQTEKESKELFIFARFHAQDGQEGVLKKAIQEEISLARNDHGCLAINAYASNRDPRLFFIHSRWIDEAAFDAHAETHHTVHFVELAETIIDHPFDANRTRILEVPSRIGGET